MRCVGYCSATSFQLNKLFDYLKDYYITQRIREVIHIQIDTGDVFFFPYATLVCWGLDEKREQALLKEIKLFESFHENQMCHDLFTFAYADSARIKDDEIVLPNEDVFSKLAFSHGIAQSVKLDTFEQTIQRTVDITRELPQRLAELGKISLSGKEIRRMMGRLFIDRHSINLHQELLDTPEFFWEYTDLEPIYKLTANYLEVARRVVVLNQRLTVLKELFDMLNNEVNHNHSTRLEWTIIWLIVIEVGLALAKDIFHLV
jgi:uncharacterized Rmd1/YagE family protein